MRAFEYEATKQMATAEFLVNGFLAVVGATSLEAVDKKISAIQKFKKILANIVTGAYFDPDFDPLEEQKSEQQQNLEILAKVSKL